MSIESKIVTRERIKDIADNLRNDVTLVTTNGCYDLMHRGHVRTFEKAKRFGDVLIVGVNSDESIRRYKTPNRPVMSELDRAYMVAALGLVDYVVIFPEDTPVELLQAIKPHIHVKSLAGYKGLEKDVVESNGGKIITIADLEGYSSGRLVEKAGQVYIRDVLNLEL